MTQPTHTDLQRDFGRMEGRMDALENLVKDGFARLEALLSKHYEDDNAKHESVDQRLDTLDILNAERRGAWKVIVAVAAAAGGVAGMAVPLVIGFFTGL